MKLVYHFGRKAEHHAELQLELSSRGYYKVPIDGIFGQSTRAAVIAFQKDTGLPATGTVDQATYDALFPRKKRRTVVDGVRNWFNGFVATTGFKYIVAMVATWIAAKMGLDPVEGKATIESVLVQGVGVVMTVWGMIESARNKIVVANKVVPIANLTSAQQHEVVKVVSDATNTPVSKLAA